MTAGGSPPTFVASRGRPEESGSSGQRPMRSGGTRCCCTMTMARPLTGSFRFVSRSGRNCRRAVWMA